jgi:hypothetical protein
MSKFPSKQNEPEPDGAVASRHRPDEVPPNQRGPAGSSAGDRHAAGSPMGGSAAGGLGGTNVGHGDPDNANIDAAGGGGDFERQLDDDEEQAYAGRSGGAVGGTPANKRVSGGHEAQHCAISPSQGESTIGRNPRPGR